MSGLLGLRAGRPIAAWCRRRRAGELQRAAERFDPVAEPEQCGPLAEVGSADPVVADRRCKAASWVRTSTFTTDACACLATAPAGPVLTPETAAAPQPGKTGRPQPPPPGH